jgi:hypothetical protein
MSNISAQKNARTLNEIFFIEIFMNIFGWIKTRGSALS